jgi:transposase
MSTTDIHVRYDGSEIGYPSELTEAACSLVGPRILPARRGRRKREANVGEVVNGATYILSLGRQWQYVPRDLPPRSTVHDYLTHCGCDGTLRKIHD